MGRVSVRYCTLRGMPKPPFSFKSSSISIVEDSAVNGRLTKPVIQECFETGVFRILKRKNE